MQRNRITVRFELETAERLSDIAAARRVTTSQVSAVRENTGVDRQGAANGDRSVGFRLGSARG